MSEIHPISARRKKVAVYIRMSTNQQQDSPERQRSQINPFCERKGYNVTDEYVDLGIGGARSDRPNFQRLLADAKKKKFDIIVVDEMSRLSRQEPIDYVAEVLYPLKTAEVMVDSLAEGLQDPGNLAGIILTVVRQDKSSGERKSLSRRVMTGLLNQALKGKYVPSTAPYGYRVAGERGNHAKKTESTRHLVFGPDEEVRVVRWMFDMVANHGWSIHAVTLELTRRGVVPPANHNGRKCSSWMVHTVRKMLRNRRYLGDCVWSNKGSSNLHELRNGEVIPTSKKGKDRKNDQADIVIVPDSHPAIIDRDTYQRAQEAIARRKKDTCPKRGEEKYLLSRMLTCTDCGGFLVGNHHNGRRYYYCQTYVSRGKHVCFRNKVWEDEILPTLIREIQVQYLNPESLARLREQLLKDLEESRQSGEADRIQVRIAKLEKDIARGNQNILLVDPSLVRGVSDTIMACQDEITRLRSQLEELSKAEHTIEEEIAMAEEWLWRLRDALTSANPSGIRAVLEQILDRVELRFTHWMSGKVNRSKLEGGVMKLKSSDLVTTLN